MRLLLAEQLPTGELLRLPGLGSSHLCVLHEEISITLVRGVPRGSTQSIYKQLKRREAKRKVSYKTQHPALPIQHSRALRLTSVPYLAMAALASCRIFSLYIWAARLLYLALASVVVQPCWRKKAV